MNKNRKVRGFTLAEVLIVVALVGVLSGVAFIAVWNHLRSMAQLERDAIAKEIYVAAQNHLTTAKSQGYLNLKTTEYGIPGTSVGDQDPQSGKIVSYYLLAPNNQTIYDLMLPFGAVDETVLARGSYIIRYQPTSASVLDVFYCERSGRFAHTFLETEYQPLVDNYRDVDKEGKTVDNKSARRNYGTDNAVIGWYGGENAVAVGERLNVPSIEIINAERLQVKVTDNNSDKSYASLKLIIEGVESTAKKAFALSDIGGRVVDKTDSTYTITLDEITNSETLFHFCDLKADTTEAFIPGENIKVFAVAYSNSTLTNIAKSIESTTNSLFGYDPKAYQEIAQISNIRHLENLDYRISHVAIESGTTKKAVQTTDLVWKKKDSVDSGLNPDGFVDIAGRGTGLNAGIIQIHPVEGGTISENCFFPVCAGISESAHFIEYDGNNHSISNVTVNYSGDAGIFGTLIGSSVSNLLVLDSTMTSSSSSGNAGGLIGSMTGTTVARCAANGTVNSDKGAAGGLIGSASSCTVTACYSGGHTDGKYASYYTDGKADYEDDGNLGNGIYNIISSSGTAGGLIGISTGTGIIYSYSTCSAKGTTAGGFAGSASGSISYCYATGLVSGATEGAFAGTCGSGTATNCYYYEIINERKDDQKGFTYVDPVNGAESYDGITALDANAQAYNDFSLPDEAGYSWQPAVPYDDALKGYYQDQDGKSVYNLKTVKQLVALGPSDNSVVISDDALINTHYGDWPAPEIFIINSNG